MSSIFVSLNKLHISVNTRDLLVAKREMKERLRLRLSFVTFKSLTSRMKI